MTIDRFTADEMQQILALGNLAGVRYRFRPYPAAGNAFADQWTLCCKLVGCAKTTGLSARLIVVCQFPIAKAYALQKLPTQPRCRSFRVALLVNPKREPL